MSRAARLDTCARCGATVLDGPDADTCALPARADPHPVSAAGEALALLARRPTYDAVLRLHGKLELHHRYSWDIAAPRRHPVLAAHSCHSPPLPAEKNPPRPRDISAWPTSEEPDF